MKPMTLKEFDEGYTCTESLDGYSQNIREALRQREELLEACKMAWEHNNVNPPFGAIAAAEGKGEQ